MVAEAGLTYSAHSWSSAVNTAASLPPARHLRVGDTVDFKPHESPVQHEMVGRSVGTGSGDDRVAR